MTNKITAAIIGCGFAGIHLALRLRALGHDVNIFSDQTPQEKLRGPLRNTTCLWGTLRSYNSRLGINYWTNPRHEIRKIRTTIYRREVLQFEAELSVPGYSIDHRLYQSTLLTELVKRGGTLSHERVAKNGLIRLSEMYDLLVVAAGTDEIGDVFKRVESQCPWRSPQRTIVSGLYDGFEFDPMPGMNSYIVPGLGELFVFPTLSPANELKTVLMFCAIPAGKLEPIVRLSHNMDLGTFNLIIVDAICQFFPDVFARMSKTEFGLTRIEDRVVGAITPFVKEGYTRLSNGRYVLALGDILSLCDPLMAQGANGAVRCAEILANQIEEGQLTIDENFCRRYDEQTFKINEAIQGWTNLMLSEPPKEHVVKFYTAAANNRRVASAYGAMFDQPINAWKVFQTIDETEAFIEQF